MCECVCECVYECVCGCAWEIGQCFAPILPSAYSGGGQCFFFSSAAGQWPDDTQEESKKRKKNFAGSEKALPTLIKEKEPLWYRAL